MLSFPKNFGSNIITAGSIKNERNIAIFADVTPSLKAVKNVEPKMLKPKSKNENVQISNANFESSNKF